MFIRSMTLQLAQAGLGCEGFDQLMYERLDATLGDYLNTLGG